MGHGKRTTITLEEATIPSDHPLQGLSKKAAIIGAIGLVASGGLAAMSSERFFFSYLTSFMWWLSIALGGLWFVLIHHATRAGWSVVVRRFAETFMAGLPVMAILFLPLLAGMNDLFHWMHPEGDKVLEGKVGYLNPTFFVIRVVFFSYAGRSWRGSSTTTLRPRIRTRAPRSPIDFDGGPPWVSLCMPCPLPSRRSTG